MRDKYVVDTSVLAEYIDEDSPFSDKIEKLFNMVKNRTVKLYITTVTIAELAYVAYRIYNIAGSTDPFQDARDYIDWLIYGVRLTIIKPSLEDALLAGRIRSLARIALPDCFVVAVSKRINAIALFLKVETEMKKCESIMREFNVKFLEEM